MTSHVLRHLAEMFARAPGLDGTIHGARRIVQGKHGSRSSLFFSAKNNAFMPAESRLERSVCYRLECDSGVANYRMQPLEIPYGTERLYPDICVRDSQGTFRILEVKPEVFVLTPENRRKADFLRTYFSAPGIDYSVVGEAYCGSEIELKNISRLYDRGGRMAVNEELLKDLATRVLRIEGSISMNEAAGRIRQAGVAHYYLEAALFHGYLKCNMRRPISQSTLVECAQ
jgi:hypothetical protein